jgi:hypothetical protein
MNAWYFLHLVLFALACLFLFAGGVMAAETASPFVQANVIFDFAADRTRMIQATVVIVVLGCALMWSCK